jgi:hypothetical protein
MEKVCVEMLIPLHYEDVKRNMLEKTSTMKN